MLLQIGVLASGEGTNLQAIIDRVEKGELPAKVALVLSDRAGSGALGRARRHGLNHTALTAADFPDKDAFDGAVIEALRAARVDLVVLAGFMRILSPGFVRAFPMRIMNIHPSLLPAFPGLHGIRDALHHGVRFTGCTVHFVDEGVDSGPIILQAVVPILEEDTEASLLERVHEMEHRIYPEAIRLFAQGRLRVEGRRVRILGEAPPIAGLRSPGGG